MMLKRSALPILHPGVRMGACLHLVFPIVLGSGKRVFRDGGEKKTLKLVETKTFASGVVVLSYEPAAKGNEK